MIGDGDTASSAKPSRKILYTFKSKYRKVLIRSYSDDELDFICENIYKIFGGKVVDITKSSGNILQCSCFVIPFVNYSTS